MRPCDNCKRDFKPGKRTSRFCSRRCSNIGAPRGQAVRRFEGTVYERNAEAIKAERRRRYATDPAYRAKVLARVSARKHVEQRPCAVCGDPRADRHHDDYSKPLDVRFLCRKCHIAHHRDELGTWGQGLR